MTHEESNMRIIAKNETHGVKTRYTVTFNGKSYFISTYPRSQHIFIETDALRHVADLSGRKIAAAFKALLVTA
jgi:hypothetical protein